RLLGCDRLPTTACPSFVSERRVAFYTFVDADKKPEHQFGGVFTVTTDGTKLRSVELPAIKIPGPKTGTPRLSQAFEIIRPGRSIGTFVLGPNQKEIFAIDGGRHGRYVQLTNFRTADMNLDFQVGDGRRVVFHAPVESLGGKPISNCQLFSVDTLGHRLHQLTYLEESGPLDAQSSSSCELSACNIIQVERDALTGTILFYSACDPFRTNIDGGQIFAMRPDGSGLRQLTHAHGKFKEEDGTLVVELPGPFRSATLGAVC